jgi:hypothetical protein
MKCQLIKRQLVQADDFSSQIPRVTESDFIAHADKGKIQRFSHEDRAVFTDASARSNTIDK